MPVITRVPVSARPDVELPDPSQRIALLRTAMRVRYARVIVAGAVGVGVALGVLALAGGIAGFAHLLEPVVVAVLVVGGMDWWDLRGELRHAEPMVEPVVLVTPRTTGNLRGLAYYAGVWAALTLLSSLIGWELLIAGVLAGFVPRLIALDLWLGARERRDGRRYLQRIELPDDDLLHAPPETVRALESRHA